MGSDFAERPLRSVEQNQVPYVSDFFRMNKVLRRQNYFLTVCLHEKNVVYLTV